MNKMIRFNSLKAGRVFMALQDAWREKKGIFANVVLPDERLTLPPDAVQAANVLFFVSITMRGAVVSDDPVRWLNMLLSMDPGVFIPEFVAKYSNEETILNLFMRITSDIQEAKGGSKGNGHIGPKYREFARSWIHNARFIDQRWGGNILQVYENVKDFEEAFARIDRRQNPDGLKGMRRKIFSLLTIWLQCQKLIPDFPTPLPIDFHAMRVLLGTEVVKTEFRLLEQATRPGMENWQRVMRVSENFTDAIAVWSQKFITDNGLDHKAINPALWVLSRTLCADHFQNSCVARTVSKAPPSKELKQKPELWPKGYRNPCQFCPVEEDCRLVFPSGPYYRWGFLTPVKRVPCCLPKQLLLFGEEQFTGRNRSV